MPILVIIPEGSSVNGHLGTTLRFFILYSGSGTRQQQKGQDNESTVNTHYDAAVRSSFVNQ